ncbi:MAG: fibronectin type III domain-containing protein, partial [Candidatus Thermoplasmatota archaeon]
MRWNGSGLALSSIAVLVIAGVAISIYSSENTGKETFTVSFRDDFGGKAFRGNTVCPINYTITGGTPNYTVELFYRFGGAGWVAIGYDNRTESGNYSYNWITPWATSTEVQLKITVTDSTLTTKYAESTRFEIDSTAPGEVTDLIATNATKTSIELQWSAPGDDGTSGSASSYDIRYNTLEITEANWNSSIQCTGEPTPTVGGTLQKFTVGELTPGTKYYFALKSKDNVGWESNISNIATAHTLVEVTLNSPVGGEAWKGDTSYTIQYSIAGTEAPFTVKLYYAYNDTSFIFIGYDNRTAAGECSYNWTTPEILSVSARVKINVTDN